MRGAPYDLSSTTLRPLGPSVTRTAWARVSIPCQHSITRVDRKSQIPSQTSQHSFLFNLISGNDRRPSLNDEDHRSDVFPGLRGGPLHGRLRTGICRRAQSGGLLLGLGLGQHPHNVTLFHDEVLDAIELDLGARPFAEQDAVTGLDVDRDELAALVAATGSNRDDLALLRLLLSGVGNDDTAGGLRLGFDTLDDDAVVKQSNFIGVLLGLSHSPVEFESR